MTETHITQERLKELFHYDPDTGLFTRLKTTGQRAFIGSVPLVKNSNGYLVVGIDYKTYKQHRLAYLYMTGVNPDQIDHIDQNRLNNKWVNLRNTNHLGNNRNKTKDHRNTSGVMGVGWNKPNRNWVSYIKVNSKLIHLGSRADYFEAVCLRKSAEVKHGFHKNHGK